MAGPRKRVLRPKSEAVKAAADRAAARSKGKPVKKAKAAIDPVIKPAAEILTEKVAAKSKSQRKRRRTRYSVPLGKAICKMLGRGLTLTAICQRPLMPKEDMVLDWAINPEHPFSRQYARAREVGYLRMGDELIDLADNSAKDFITRSRKDGSIEMVLNREHLERTKLRIETRKWVLSKALPKVFGDMLAIPGQATAPTDVAREAPRKPADDHLANITARYAKRTKPNTVVASDPKPGNAKPKGSGLHH